MQTDWQTMEDKLAKELTKSRFRHTQAVMYTACSLAMRYDENLDQVRTAGLLHDCAKCIPNKKKIEMCRKKNLPVSDFEMEHPVLLHAKLGKYLAAEEYGIKDPEILSAIEWHTTGRPGMSQLEKIIYIADYIEPGRDKAPRLNEIRRMAFADLDQCMEMILADTVSYLSSNPKSMDHKTVEAYQYYHLKQSKERKGAES
ncbi:MAG: bis(5'-nucleosyl)-tetraphosphatase (symmetrical) YqeK [Eubacterium sp.]|nr:bis(5'-nucleosyl)-tetraphosphatase (symmetrical) YqeK [Eubacterium sp.]